jgi:hypothetical protein
MSPAPDTAAQSASSVGNTTRQAEALACSFVIAENLSTLQNTRGFSAPASSAENFFRASDPRRRCRGPTAPSSNRVKKKYSPLVPNAKFVFFAATVCFTHLFDRSARASGAPITSRRFITPPDHAGPIDRLSTDSAVPTTPALSLKARLFCIEHAVNPAAYAATPCLSVRPDAGLSHAI